MAPKVKVPMDFGLHLKHSPTHNTLKLNTSNGETVYASSVILSFNSPVIDHMTTTLHMTSVDMLEFSKTAVEVFVDAAYSGKADEINKEVFREINKMATVFEMKWLAEKCFVFFRQLVDAIGEPLYKELFFWFEEAGFVLQNLKLIDYIIVIDEKLKIMGYKQQFIEKYLGNPENLSTEKLDMVIALAGKEVNCIVNTVVHQLSEQFKAQGPGLPKPFKYLLENANLCLCKQNEKALFDRLFDFLRCLPDEHMRWTFDLYRKSCEGNVSVLDVTRTDRSRENSTSQNHLLPCHDLDLTMTLEQLVNWLSVSEKCTSLLMALEAFATWRQYHIHEVRELTSDVLFRLDEKLKNIAKKRRWSLLSSQLKRFMFCFGYWNGRCNVLVSKFGLTPFICDENDTTLIVINNINCCSGPCYALSKESKLLFHFKHPAASTCNRLSDCGFILKTVRSEGVLWKVKLCTEEEDYKDEMLHFHEEVRVDKMHFCFTSDNGSDSYHVPLSWLGWISSDEELERWEKNYRFLSYRQYTVLYDTSV